MKARDVGKEKSKVFIEVGSEQNYFVDPKQPEGTPPPTPLTPDELRQISREYFGEDRSDDQADLMIRSKPDPDTYGYLAELPEARLLHWLDILEDCQMNDREGSPPRKFVAGIFKFLGEQFLQEDPAFFERLALLLRARKDGRKYWKIPRKKLGIPSSAGRKQMPYDLCFAVPAAVHRVLGYRVFELPPDGIGHGWRLHRITREELRMEIAVQQKWRGLEEPIPISNHELSRWIKKTGVSKFMEAS